MKVFLSYAAYDMAVAQFVKATLESRLGVEFFLLPDDAPPGLPWMEQIKIGVHAADELYSLVTPEYASRPWMSAEWACFWIQGKPTTPLLIDFSVSNLWEPMRGSQCVDLAEYSAVRKFLKTVAEKTGEGPVEGVNALAREFLSDIPGIRTRQREADVSRAIRILKKNVLEGGDSVSPTDVKSFVRHNRVGELLDIATSRAAYSVQQRQVAVALIDIGRIDDAVRVGMSMQNRAEVRTVCRRIVEKIPRGATEDSDEWKALGSLYERLGTPQRRDVREIMDECGIIPLGRWALGARAVTQHGHN